MFVPDPAGGEMPETAIAPSLPAVGTANRMLSALWRRGLSEEPALQFDRLVRVALGDASTSDLDWAADWETPLRLLIDSLNREAALSPLGRTIAHALIVKALRDRRRAIGLWRRHPEIGDRPVTAPVIVLGPMRSGTTRLQRLLACDPRFVHTRLFETLSPVPLGGRVDLRPAAAAFGLRLLKLLNPALPAVHPTGAYAPEEEFGLFNLSFASAQFEAQWRVPSFSRWWEAADMGGVYSEFAMLIRTIGWARGDAPDRTWLMKAPQFSQDLDALLDTFPDVRLIRLERDPAQVVGSSASLVWQQMRIQSDSADPHWIGREWLRKFRLRQERTTAALEKRPDVRALTLHFNHVGSDWRAEIGRVYDFLGFTLSPEAEARMNRYVAGETAHLGHRYRLEQFGLTPAEVVG